jgi:aminoglycoside 6'-N-acetyltransferase I
MRALLWPDSSRRNHAWEARRILSRAHPPTSPLGVLPHSVFVAQEPDRGLVGFVEVTIRPIAEGCTTSSVGYIEGWFVEASHRRRGVGRALVTAAETWAQSRGCREMGSDCVLANRTSELAHRALGYSEVERAIHFLRKLPRRPGAARRARRTSG